MPPLTEPRRRALVVLAEAADQCREVHYSNTTSGIPDSWDINIPSLVHWQAADWLQAEGLVKPVTGPEFLMVLTDAGRALAAEVTP